MRQSLHRRIKKTGLFGTRSRLLSFCGGVIFLIGILPAVIILALRWLPPPTTAFMLESQLTSLLSERPQPIRYQWTPWPEISPHLPLAVLAAEDQKFLRHWGFDFDSIAKAMESNKKGKQLRGASTISQQVAKNLFLWPGRSYLRKGLEAYFTVLIELLWPKKRILEIYVNIAQFGDGIFGAHAAATSIFRKKPVALRAGEAALLAAVLPNPLVLKAHKPSSYVLERKRWIMGQMRQLNGPAHLQGLAP
ncbi:MAG: monofunctional biosynthetic peptidoglycan transglycosylase [Thermodesulfobacteriota bacterium]